MTQLGKPYVPSHIDREKVKALVFTGATQVMISRVLGICVDTLTTHYRYELDNAEIDVLNAVAAKANELAMDGNDKMISLILKTKGAKVGWVEKQVIETTSSEELNDLKGRVQELEQEHTKEY